MYKSELDINSKGVWNMKTLHFFVHVFWWLYRKQGLHVYVQGEPFLGGKMLDSPVNLKSQFIP